MSIFCCFKHHHQSSSDLSPDANHEPFMSGALPQRRFLQPNSPHESKHTLSSLKSDQDAHDLRNNLSPPGDVNERGCPRSLSPSKLHDSILTKTNSSLSNLSFRLRTRFSRDSNISKTSSGPKKATVPEEETERHKELKRALYERVRTEIFQDGRGSCAGCDPDAQLIATPATVGSIKQGDDLNINQSPVQNVIRKLDLVAIDDVEPAHGNVLGDDDAVEHTIQGTNGKKCEVGSPKPRRDRIERHAARLHKASSVKQKKIPVGNMLDSPTIRKRSTVADLRPSKPVIKDSTGYIPLRERSETFSEFPAHPDCIEIALSPDLLPLRLPSISATSERALRLSQSCIVANLDQTKNTPAISRVSSLDCEIPEGDWLRAAPKVAYAGRLPGDHGSDFQSFDRAMGTPSDSVAEETRFGSVDDEGVTGWVSPTASFGKASHCPVGRRDVSKSSSTRQSSAASPFISTASSSSAVGSSKNDHLRDRQGSCQRRICFQGSWLPVAQDAASSVYASQAGSPLPSPTGSFIRPFNLIDRLRSHHPRQKSSSSETANSSLVDLSRISASPLDSLEADLRRRKATTTSSFQSSTDSFRARELAASERRIVSRSRTDSFPRQSRFKEDLDPTVDIPEEPPCLLTVPYLGPDHISTDGGEDWYPSARRSGSCFAFLPGENTVAADSWERALRATAEQNLLVPRRPSSARQSSQSLQTQLAVYESKKRLSLLSTVDTNFLTVEPRRKRRFMDSVEQLDPLRSEPSSPNSGQSLEEPSDQPVSTSNPQAPAPPKPYPESWTRFPSYSRPARCFSSAGAADNVKHHDFALDYPAVPKRTSPAAVPSRELSASKGKTKSSLHLGHAFKRVGQLYKSHSANLARFEHGYRSSISGGGILKYPELEIPQPLVMAPPATMPSSSLHEQRPSTDSGKPGEMAQSAEHDGHEVSLDGMAMPLRNAKVWSRLYEDCVEYPASSSEAVGGSPVSERAGRASGMSRSWG